MLRLSLRRFVTQVPVVVVVAMVAASPARAQTSTGTRTWTVNAGVDFPTVYIFRGIVQEGDPKLTITPHADVDWNLTRSGRVRVGAGTWNSFNTGTSGSGGPLDNPYYAAQFSGRVAIDFAHGFTVTPSFFANTSPNDGYDPIREIDVTIAKRGWLSPYAMVAFELSDSGQLDEGQKKGRYLEVGVTPHIGRRGLGLSIPAKAGFSLGDYYELFGRDLMFTDHRFGFVEGGAHVAIPIAGSLRLVGGGDVYVFGDSTRAFNLGDRFKVVGTIGIAYAK